ncbi:diaminopimelate epimerase [Lysobacter sp. A286]
MAEPATSVAVPALRFSKMHGAGNDFVVLDLRGKVPAPSRSLCRALADRHTGVGCDQVLTVEPAREPGSAASYRIWNADGSGSQQCGNGARCIAAWLVRDGAASASADFAMDSPAGTHVAEQLDDGGFRVAMGVPQFDPVRIPLHGFNAARDAYVLPVRGSIIEVGAVSLGNPHALIEVEQIDDAPLEAMGRNLQHSAAFPESVNVGFVQVVARDHIRLRVYERGVGETLACGSGACAAVAILVRRGRVDRDVRVVLPGGELRVTWPDNDAPMQLAGPAKFVFEGEWTA